MSLLAEHAVALYPSGQFADAAPVLSILAISLAFLGPTMVCATYLTAIGRMWTILGAYALALPLQVIANLILIDFAGAVGVAIATVFAHAALAIGLVVVVIASGIRIPFAAFARHLAAAAGMGLVILATRGGPMIAAIAAGGLTYGALLFLLSRPDSLERRLLNMTLERWRR
jgi:O-antigen/teichoic acid export membrane protein